MSIHTHKKTNKDSLYLLLLSANMISIEWYHTRWDRTLVSFISYNNFLSKKSKIEINGSDLSISASVWTLLSLLVLLLLLPLLIHSLSFVSFFVFFFIFIFRSRENSGRGSISFSFFNFLFHFDYLLLILFNCCLIDEFYLIMPFFLYFFRVWCRGWRTFSISVEIFTKRFSRR